MPRPHWSTAVNSLIDGVVMFLAVGFALALFIIVGVVCVVIGWALLYGG